MFCPQCGSEYRLGFTECAFCHVELVEALEEEPQSEEPEGHSDWHFDTMSEVVDVSSERPHRAPEDDAVGGPWVVVAEHVMNTGLVPVDAPSIQLLALESELQAQGIDVMFEPFRPGEGSAWTRSMAQPIRLMVREPNLTRAREIAAELAAEGGLGGE